jgi:hypothetical protein
MRLLEERVHVLEVDNEPIAHPRAQQRPGNRAVRLARPAEFGSGRFQPDEYRL